MQNAPHAPPLMIGLKDERVLRIDLPHVDLWNAWLSGSRSHPNQVPPLRTLVDTACHAVGRDPVTLTSGSHSGCGYVPLRQPL